MQPRARQRNVWGWRAMAFGLALAGMAGPLGAQEIYFTDWTGSRIKMVNADGTGAQTVYTANAYTTGLDYDAGTGMFYYGDSLGRIVRLTKDGTGVTNPTVIVDTANSYIWNLALDDGMIFFNSTESGVGKVSTAGGAVTQVGPVTPGEGLSLNPDTNQLYFQTFSPTFGNNYRSNYSGGSLTFLGNYSPFSFIPGIRVDPENGWVYWAGGNAILRTDLNGANLSVVASGGLLANVYTMDIDYATDTLYFGTFNGVIGKMNLDGTGLAQIASGQGAVYAIAVVPEPGTVALFGAGLAALVLRKRRRGAGMR